MSYTLEDYRRDLKERALKMMTPEERLNNMEKSVKIDIIIKKYLKNKPESRMG